MKKKYGIILVILFVAICVILFAFNWVYFLLFIFFIVIQLPFIGIMFKKNTNKSYLERAEMRRQNYVKNKNAEQWLAEEKKETKNIGYKYWSKRGLNTSILNQAIPLFLTGQKKLSYQYMQTIHAKKLLPDDLKRYQQLKEQLQKKDK